MLIHFSDIRAKNIYLDNDTSKIKQLRNRSGTKLFELNNWNLSYM